MDKIMIGSDHGGYPLKEDLKAYLSRKGYPVVDAGTFSEESCDYTDYAFAVAKGVSERKCRRGILICKSGIGNSIAANKLPGVRAALCYNLTCTRLSREHNDSNILVLGAAFTPAALAKRMVDTWLKTEFAGGRHTRRLNKIRKIERYVAGICSKRK